MPYGPIVDVLRGDVMAASLGALDPMWSRELAQFLPDESNGPSVGSGLDGEGTRGRLFEAIGRALLVNGRPLALMIDDVHWCDGDTLDLLEFVVRFGQQLSSPLLVVGTADGGTGQPAPAAGPGPTPPPARGDDRGAAGSPRRHRRHAVGDRDDRRADDSDRGRSAGRCGRGEPAVLDRVAALRPRRPVRRRLHRRRRGDPSTHPGGDREPPRSALGSGSGDGDGGGGRRACVHVGQRQRVGPRAARRSRRDR